MSVSLSEGRVRAHSTPEPDEQPPKPGPVPDDIPSAGPRAGRGAGLSGSAGQGGLRQPGGRVP
ncbi:hypothetical protein LP419_03630 [Massilia sp. H-1]|nr:hypothetical protein LP419_03630 [Massilia sp. H-1]